MPPVRQSTTVVDVRARLAALMWKALAVVSVVMLILIVVGVLLWGLDTAGAIDMPDVHAVDSGPYHDDRTLGDR